MRSLESSPSPICASGAAAPIAAARRAQRVTRPTYGCCGRLDIRNATVQHGTRDAGIATGQGVQLFRPAAKIPAAPQGPRANRQGGRLSEIYGCAPAEDPTSIVGVGSNIPP
jgi:hypothetical protein